MLSASKCSVKFAELTMDITADDLKKRLEKGEKAIIVDVRTPGEYEEIHIQDAQLIPLDIINLKKINELRAHAPDASVYVLCRTGTRSQMAIDKLKKEGGKNIYSVRGGTLACVESGIPCVRGCKQVMTIEEQVRLTVGIFVSIFGLLGYFVHPLFIIIPVLIGLGLISSTITKKCHLALLLTKMSWNRK